MESKNTPNSQICKAAEVLKRMRPNISSEDRKQAMKELGVTPFTLSNYLNGKGRDLSTAENLIVFFRQTVSRREKVLAGE